VCGANMADEVSTNDYIRALSNLMRTLFLTDPILVSGGNIPIDSFVGRREELKRLYDQFESRVGTRTIVIGDTGVGKTSFVNYALYSIKDKYFIPKPINVLGEWKSEDFLINTLVVIANEIKKEGNEGIDDDILKKLESVTELNRVNMESHGIQLPFALGGLNSGKGTSNPENTPYTSLEELFKLIITQIFTKQDKETIIVYDNLENLLNYVNPKEYLAKIKQIFNDIRDTFQEIPNAHFVLIGNSDIDDVIQQEEMHRVYTTFTEPIYLKPMKLNEISEILKNRLEFLKPGEGMQKPYDDEVLATLYDVYDGNIRDILKRLDTAVRLYIYDKSVILTIDKLINIFNDELNENFLNNNLHDRDKKILYAIANANRGETTIKNISESKSTGVTRENIRVAISNELKNVVSKWTDGKDDFLSISPEMRWKILNLLDINDLKRKRLNIKH